MWDEFLYNFKHDGYKATFKAFEQGHFFFLVYDTTRIESLEYLQQRYLSMFRHSEHRKDEKGEDK